MVICKDGVYAYTGKTATEAYLAYLEAGDANDFLPPDRLTWYDAKEMLLEMSLTGAKPVKKDNKK